MRISQTFDGQSGGLLREEEATVAAAETRKRSVKVYLASRAVAILLKEPPALPKRPVELVSSSFSPTAPMSLPSVKPNICSVSTSPTPCAALRGSACADAMEPNIAVKMTQTRACHGEACSDQRWKNMRLSPSESKRMRTAVTAGTGRSDQRQGFRRSLERNGVRGHEETRRK